MTDIRSVVIFWVEILHPSSSGPSGPINNAYTVGPNYIYTGADLGGGGARSEP